MPAWPKEAKTATYNISPTNQQIKPNPNQAPNQAPNHPNHPTPLGERNFYFWKSKAPTWAPKHSTPVIIVTSPPNPARTPPRLKEFVFSKVTNFFLSVLPHKQHANPPFQLPNKKLHNTKSFTYSTLKILNNHINLKHHKNVEKKLANYYKKL